MRVYGCKYKKEKNLVGSKKFFLRTSNKIKEYTTSMFFLLLPPKDRTKETCLPAGRSHRCMKFAKNLRHSLNCGNSSLRSSNTPQFLTLIP
jgi:hypothetical protein